jgi:hypothetical protein
MRCGLQVVLASRRSKRHDAIQAVATSAEKLAERGVVGLADLAFAAGQAVPEHLPNDLALGAFQLQSHHGTGANGFKH